MPSAPSPRRVLVVAYYFPPMGLSGVQRVAKLVKYLPLHGWQPEVLTVQPGAYFAYDDSLMAEVDKAGTPVHRTASWDPTQLSGGARTVPLPAEGSRRLWSVVSQFVFVPDTRIGWFPHAVRRGLKVLAERRFDAIFSSAPPYTGHLVALRLSRASGLPLVTDFRDDWTGNPRHHYPTPLHARVNRGLERRVLARSSAVTTINEPMRRALATRHAEAGVHPDVSVLSQGFDPEDFEVDPVARTPEKMRLLYCGIFYDAQTPDHFLRGLAEAFHRAPALRDGVEAVFVGLVPEASQDLARTLGLAESVTYTGYLPHAEAVAHLKGADVLWMTVGRQPGADGISTSKLFEYFGARKPVWVMAPPGAARDGLDGYGAGITTPPDDVAIIATTIIDLHARWRAGTLPTPDEAYVSRFDRRELAGHLARLLAGAGAGR